MSSNSEPASSSMVASFIADSVSVRVFETPLDAGRAAAAGVALSIRDRTDTVGCANVVFAAAPSQNEFLRCAASDSGIQWSSVNMFHMDEYIGLSRDQPESFRHYLDEHLLRHVRMKSINLIDAGARFIPSVCSSYEALLRKSKPDIVCAGIGENGHVAFNDPSVADFDDPLWVKVVRLDEMCRGQQVRDGCFRHIDDVPKHAITLTIPALLQATTISVVVVGKRKMDAVRDMLVGPIGESCPASVLRRAGGVVLYLDRESAGRVL